MMKKLKQKRNKVLGDYIIQETIGKGTFGKVKLGIYIPTRDKVAVKILEKSKLKDRDDHERVLREMEIIKHFNNENVVQVYEILEDNDKFYLVTEFCEEGELFNYIVRKKRLNEDEAAYYFYQIINGLENIHSYSIVHRDLKPENLLITVDKKIKIIDFGLSNFFRRDTSEDCEDNVSDANIGNIGNTGNNVHPPIPKYKLLSTPCGSPCYASPEMVSGKKYNGFMIDIWSCGIILFAMISGYLPFEDPDNEKLFVKILECSLTFPSHVSNLVKDMIKRILVTDPEKRITIAEIKKHNFYLHGKAIYNKEFASKVGHNYNNNVKNAKSENKNNKVPPLSIDIPTVADSNRDGNNGRDISNNNIAGANTTVNKKRYVSPLKERKENITGSANHNLSLNFNNFMSSSVSPKAKQSVIANNNVVNSPHNANNLFTNPILTENYNYEVLNTVANTNSVSQYANKTKINPDNKSINIKGDIFRISGYKDKDRIIDREKFKSSFVGNPNNVNLRSSMNKFQTDKLNETKLTNFTNKRDFERELKTKHNSIMIQPKNDFMSIVDLPKTDFNLNNSNTNSNTTKSTRFNKKEAFNFGSLDFHANNNNSRILSPQHKHINLYDFTSSSVKRSGLTSGLGSGIRLNSGVGNGISTVTGIGQTINSIKNKYLPSINKIKIEKNIFSTSNNHPENRHNYYVLTDTNDYSHNESVRNNKLNDIMNSTKARDRKSINLLKNTGFSSGGNVGVTYPKNKINNSTTFVKIKEKVKDLYYKDYLSKIGVNS